MFSPEIADRAGRGALCAEIDAVVKAMSKSVEAHQFNDGPDPRVEHDYKMLEKRLDDLRRKFHNLYGKKVNDNGPVRTGIS